jgi:hypothetical protein
VRLAREKAEESRPDVIDAGHFGATV